MGNQRLRVHPISVLIIEVCVVVLFFVFLDFYVLPNDAYIRAYDWFFFEGIFCVIFGVLFFLGRGGINRYSLGSAATRAASDAVYGTAYGVSDAFRKDKWKPQGFRRAALVLLISGLVLFVIYLFTFKIA